MAIQYTFTAGFSDSKLNDLTLRIKDKDGKGTTLRCTGTNYYEIGF
ncbi:MULTISPECIES: hypothetical protein [Acinetobacter]|nr:MULTISPECIES: hypothetical protein [Acinetobacter]